VRLMQAPRARPGHLPPLHPPPPPPPPPPTTTTTTTGTRPPRRLPGPPAGLRLLRVWNFKLRIKPEFKV
jgi:hypothetical protein